VVVAIGLYLWLRPNGPRAEPHVADTATVRTTQQGEAIGFTTRQGAHAWLGLPYAKPPVGELRWRAPQPAAPWAGRRDALAISNVCMQFPSVISGVAQRGPADAPIGSEDCLYLNIYAPLEASGTTPNRPVMFWIHGGGNSIGQGGTYDGSELAKRHDVVVVTFNYRLGPFGWFAHPALKSAERTVADNSGNYGTLDQIAALEWVRDNIAAFGGDKSNVTIFGESAGGTDVLALLVSPRAKGLFHRAIVESGGLYLTPIASAANYSDAAEPGNKMSAREIVNAMLVRDGRAPDRAAAKSVQDAMSDADVRTYLANEPATGIMRLFTGGAFGMINAPEVFGDGEVLPAGAQAAQLFADASRYNAVPTILGTNRDELALFMARNPRWTKTYLWFFPRLKDEAAYRRFIAYNSMAWKARGVDEIADVMHATQGDTVYAYRFDWDEEPSVMGFDLSKALGAAHGLEIAFVFGNFDNGFASYLYRPSPERDALSASMMSYWAEFARSGSPGRGRDGKEVEWTPWDTAGARSILFDTKSGGGVRMSDLHVTYATIRAQLSADTSFTDPKDRCELYARIFAFDLFDQAEYERLGCAAFDPKSFTFF